MNEVARNFWNEIYDIRRPAQVEDRRSVKQREKLVRRVANRRPMRPAA